MRKRILAICDLEALYACNFMQYIGQKRTIPFEVQAYTGVDKLIEAAGKGRIDVLLISDKAMDERVSELPVGQIIILSEGVHDPRLDHYPSIYKYQSSETVIREVMACYGETLQEIPPEAALKRPMEIIGVYSPLGRVQKTFLALTIGQLLARDRAALYLNLEEYSGFEQIFQKNYDSNLSDLLYYLRQRQQNLSRRIAHITQSVGNLDYIPPAISPADIRMAEYADWDFLLDELEYRSSYEALVLDLGDGVEELFRVMERCSRIYMPVLGDVVSQAKVQQFEQLIRLQDAVPLLEKIQKVKLPFCSLPGCGEQYIEQLVWSQLGDCARGLLREERK